MRETETIVSRIMAESDTRTLEADRLKNELLKARLAEKDAKEKLLQFLSQPALENVPPGLLSSMNVRSSGISKRSRASSSSLAFHLSSLSHLETVSCV